LPSINQTLNLVINESRKEPKKRLVGYARVSTPATGASEPDEGAEARRSRLRRRARAWPDARSSRALDDLDAGDAFVIAEWATRSIWDGLQIIEAVIFSLEGRRGKKASAIASGRHS
jgi:hypothetical protein